MLLYEILTDFVFRSIPVVSTSTTMVLMELLFQIFSPAYLIFAVVRKRSAAEKCIIATIPMVLIVTTVLMNIFLGGSFLGGGFHYGRELVQFVEESRLREEVVWILLLFPVTAVFTEVIHRKSVKNEHPVWRIASLPGTLFNIMMYVFCLVPTVSLFGKGHLPELGALTEKWLVLWYVYSIYNLLFGISVHIMALLVHFLFSQREIEGNVEELSCDSDWCERKIRAYFSDSYKLCAITFGMLLLLFLAVTVPEIFSGGTLRDVGFLSLFVVPLLVFALYNLFRGLFPGTLSSVKSFQRWGNEDVIRRRFCLEILAPNVHVKSGYRVTVSRHFIITPKDFFRKLYYIPDFEEIRMGKNGREICFKDGSRIAQRCLHEEDWRILLLGLQNANMR